VAKEAFMATSMTYEELHKKTVAELRDIAKGLEHEAVQGYTQMNKEHLLPALCKALGIDTHAHHHAESGFDKQAVKARIRKLQSERDKLLEAHDSKALKGIRREIHTLNHRLRGHTV
jgi:hypothetical protein